MITGRPRTLRSGFSLPEPAADTVNREPLVDQLIDMSAWLPLALWGTMGGTVLGLLAGGLLLRLFAPRSVEPPEFGDPADFTVVDFEYWQREQAPAKNDHGNRRSRLFDWLDRWP